MIDYSLILTHFYEGSEWILDGEEYSGLTWLSDTSKPSKKDLDSLWDQTLAKIEQQKISFIAKKQNILDRLGITEEESKLLLG